MAGFTASTSPGDVKRSPGDMLSMRMGITKIFKGDQVIKKTDGYVYSAYAGGATGDQFVGVAAETVDNRYITDGVSDSGAATAGLRQIRLWQEGIFTFTIASSVIQTELGLTVYNERGATGTPTTVTKTAGDHGCIVGVITKLPTATTARVRIASFSTIAT